MMPQDLFSLAGHVQLERSDLDELAASTWSDALRWLGMVVEMNFFGGFSNIQ